MAVASSPRASSGLVSTDKKHKHQQVKALFTVVHPLPTRRLVERLWALRGTQRTTADRQPITSSKENR